jgi:hypothetical protein
MEYLFFGIYFINKYWEYFFEKLIEIKKEKVFDSFDYIKLKFQFLFSFLIRIFKKSEEI